MIGSAAVRMAATAAGLGLLALLALSFTAANSVPASRVGQVDGGPIGASQLEPAACTGTVSAIVNVPSGGSSFTVSTANKLILGTPGQDKVTATTGYQCFVGGGPVSPNSDQFTGPSGGGDQCIGATADATGNIHNCTIVQRRP